MSDDLKSARVVPIFKKNDKTEVGNYRRVSILSIISKVFERVVYDQLETYLDKEKLLYYLLSGFRPKYSTDTCMIHLTDFIKFQMDKGNAVSMVLLDLQKAFDTVDHSILLAKLEVIGLSNDIVKWFQSYCLVVNNVLMLPELFLHVQILQVVLHKSQYLDLCCF